MRTHTLRLILTLAAAVAALNGPAALTATEYRVSDYLPLTAGNSWNYIHNANDTFGRLPGSRGYSIQQGDLRAWEGSDGFSTLTVEPTEEVDGKTSYVLSDMPSGGWPAAPSDYIARKKLGWDGRQLMKNNGTGKQTLYDFGAALGKSKKNPSFKEKDEGKITEQPSLPKKKDRKQKKQGKRTGLQKS